MNISHKQRCLPAVGVEILSQAKTSNRTQPYQVIVGHKWVSVITGSALLTPG